MATYTADLTTTAVNYAEGVDPTPGVGQKYYLTVGGTWTTGDKFTIAFIETLSGATYTFGAGSVTGVEPTVVFTYKDKVYVGADTTFYFSAVGEPTVFNDPNAAGNGYLDMSDSSATAEKVMAFAPYQGRLAVIGASNDSQIWQVDPDPTNYLLTQDLPHIGTFATKSVMAIGDLDVYLLSRTGFRSIRVRDASNNAMVIDVGSPIDSLVQELVESDGTGSEVAVVEPSTNRYWCWLGSKLFVLSSFPSASVLAWSTYTLPGTPDAFAVLAGRVYLRVGDSLYLFGGSDNSTYDSTVASWSTYYMDAKSPSTRKSIYGIDAAFSGAWTVSFGTDPVSGVMKTVYQHNEASYWQGRIPVTQSGYFFRVAAQTTGATAASFDAFSVLFRAQDTI